MGCSFCPALLIILVLFKIENVNTLANSLDRETFDFIVVGAGTAGCALASRLAESGEHSVLLISEGTGFPPDGLDVPALTDKFWGDPNIVKVYQSVAQANAGLATDGKITFPVGRPLGGGSAVNWMILNRGHPQDYNNWAKLTEDESWSYTNLLKYFRKYENYTENNPKHQRGHSGPISVSLPRFAPGLQEWLDAGVELGYPNTGPNDPQTKSVTWMEFSQKNGRRVSSFKGYILPLLHSNPNKMKLSIRLRTTASRIIFEGKRAVGVRTLANFSGEASIRFVYAKKEIIITAGVIGSPTLLMRSGIGRKAVLDGAEIPPVKYLPVGQNFQDHVGTPHMIFYGNKSAASSEHELTPEALTLYEQTGSGPYSSLWAISGQAFLLSPGLSQNEKDLGWPDIQLLAANSNSTPYLQGSPQLSDLRDGEINVVWASALVRPKSRGSVTLDLGNIDNPPLIDFNFFSHPNDIRNLIAGTKAMIRLCEDTLAFQEIGCRLPAIPIPACSHLDFRSDPYWECYIRQLTFSGLHASGSCKMGSGPRDAWAVVDTQLKVIGVEGLRIADASIMPVITNANTQGAVYVIAEKAAEMILKAWGNSSAKALRTTF